MGKAKNKPLTTNKTDDGLVIDRFCELKKPRYEGTQYRVLDHQGALILQRGWYNADKVSYVWENIARGGFQDSIIHPSGKYKLCMIYLPNTRKPLSKFLLERLFGSFDKVVLQKGCKEITSEDAHLINEMTSL